MSSRIQTVLKSAEQCGQTGSTSFLISRLIIPVIMAATIVYVNNKAGPFWPGFHCSVYMTLKYDGLISRVFPLGPALPAGVMSKLPAIPSEPEPIVSWRLLWPAAARAF